MSTKFTTIYLFHLPSVLFIVEVGKNTVLTFVSFDFLSDLLSSASTRKVQVWATDFVFSSCPHGINPKPQRNSLESLHKTYWLKKIESQLLILVFVVIQFCLNFLFNNRL